MRVFLTGASGYLGLHVLRELLAHGDEVTAAVRVPDRLGPLASHPRVVVWRTDLDDLAVRPPLPGHDALVHAALLWGPEGTEARDAVVAARLFDAAGAAGVGRIVFVSSTAVHRPFRASMAEDDALAPTEPYGATKLAGERALRAASASGVVIRPGPIVGPPAFPGAALRSDRRLLAMIEAARVGRPIEVVRGDARQWSDVLAVARAIGRLVRAPEPHPTYVCVDRDVLPWARIAAWVVAALGSRSEIVVHDPPMAAQRFRTARIEALLGGPAPASAAAQAHIAALAG